MKKKFGEKKTDRDLIKDTKALNEMIDVFNDSKENDMPFKNNLNKLRKYSIADMREISNANRTKKYDGTFESLIDTIYQIRCNLFHGRKNPEEDKNDYELICLAYGILLSLFEKYLEKCGYT